MAVKAALGAKELYCMTVFQRIKLALGMISTLLAVVACGERALPTPIAPVGSVKGLTTFIYVYSEN